jgi:hypothetical protein
MVVTLLKLLYAKNDDPHVQKYSLQFLFFRKEMTKTFEMFGEKVANNLAKDLRKAVYAKMGDDLSEEIRPFLVGHEKLGEKLSAGYWVNLCPTKGYGEIKQTLTDICKQLRKVSVPNGWFRA